MAILLLDDGRTLEGQNKDELLAELLRDRGHDTLIFSGHDSRNRKINDPKVAALELRRIVGSTKLNGIVLDLHWFGNPDYGIELLTEFQGISELPHDCKIIVYSHHLDDPDLESKLAHRFGVSSSEIFSRNNTPIEDIVEQF